MALISVADTVGSCDRYISIDANEAKPCASEHFKFENRKPDGQQQGRGHDRVTGSTGRRSVDRARHDRQDQRQGGLRGPQQLSASRPGRQIGSRLSLFAER